MPQIELQDQLTTIDTLKNLSGEDLSHHPEKISAAHEALDANADQITGLTKEEAAWLRQYRTASNQKTLETLVELREMQHKGDTQQQRVEGTDKKRAIDDLRLRALRAANGEIDRSLRGILHTFETDRPKIETISAEMAHRLHEVLKVEWAAREKIDGKDDSGTWKKFREELREMEPASLEFLDLTIQQQIELLEKDGNRETAREKTAVFLDLWRKAVKPLVAMERDGRDIYSLETLITYCRKLAGQCVDRDFFPEIDSKLSDFSEIGKADPQPEWVFQEAIAILEGFAAELKQIPPYPSGFLHPIQSETWIRRKNDLVDRLRKSRFVHQEVTTVIDSLLSRKDNSWDYTKKAHYFEEPVEFLRRMKDVYEFLQPEETRRQIQSQLHLINLRECETTINFALNRPPLHKRQIPRTRETTAEAETVG